MVWDGRVATTVRAAAQRERDVRDRESQSVAEGSIKQSERLGGERDADCEAECGY